MPVQKASYFISLPRERRLNRSPFMLSGNTVRGEPSEGLATFIHELDHTIGITHAIASRASAVTFAENYTLVDKFIATALTMQPFDGVAPKSGSCWT